jgi:hypothetical protein
MTEPGSLLFSTEVGEVCLLGRIDLKKSNKTCLSRTNPFEIVTLPLNWASFYVLRDF